MLVFPCGLAKHCLDNVMWRILTIIIFLNLQFTVATVGESAGHSKHDIYENIERVCWTQGTCLILVTIGQDMHSMDVC